MRLHRDDRQRDAVRGDELQRLLERLLAGRVIALLERSRPNWMQPSARIGGGTWPPSCSVCRCAAVRSPRRDVAAAEKMDHQRSARARRIARRERRRRATRVIRAMHLVERLATRPPEAVREQQRRDDLQLGCGRRGIAAGARAARSACRSSGSSGVTSVNWYKWLCMIAPHASVWPVDVARCASNSWNAASQCRARRRGIGPQLATFRPRNSATDPRATTSRGMAAIQSRSEALRPCATSAPAVPRIAARAAGQSPARRNKRTA